MRIISVTNQKGGCGKTTTAVNLAACLAVNKRRVLLIDLDPQSHATLGLNVKSELSIYNVLSKLTNKKTGLDKIIKNLGENFDLAPSSMILSTLEQELAGEIGRESRLLDTLNYLKENNRSSYDYILIDCPPNLGILTINAIRASSEIIIPVEASRFSLEGLSQLVEIINLIKDRLNHNVTHRVLVTNFDSRLRHSFKMLDRIKFDFDEALFSNIIHVNVKLKEAQNQGTHILNHDKYCRGAKDYFSLAREIITQEANPLKSRDPLEGRMNAILKKKLPKLSHVEFAISAPEAHEVHIAGDFNNWKLDDNSRMEHENGSWTKRMDLSAGHYHYRFVVDGRWTEDPKNPSKERNPYGEMDSLVDVTL